MDMYAHGAGGNVQLLGDFLVTLAVRHQSQSFLLPMGQRLVVIGCGYDLGRYCVGGADFLAAAFVPPGSTNGD